MRERGREGERERQRDLRIKCEGEGTSSLEVSSVRTSLVVLVRAERMREERDSAA